MILMLQMHTTFPTYLFIVSTVFVCTISLIQTYVSNTKINESCTIKINTLCESF